MATPLAVLIVEDSDSDAQLIVRLLKQAGYAATFQIVENAEQMRIALEQETWDVVISDYSLPQFNGRAALGLLQETGLDLPFITVSGTMGEATAVAMMKIGAHDYMMKDNLARLAPAVQRELREADTRRARKRAEAALRQAETKYRNIFENATEGIFQSTPAGKFITANPALARMVGYDSPAELIATVNDLSREFYASPARRVEFMKQMSDQGMVSNFEYAVYRKDGRTIWISENARTVRDNAGQVLYEGTQIDITERKRAEEEIRHRADEFAALYETSRDLTLQLDLSMLLQTITEKAIALLGADNSLIYLYDAAADNIELAVTNGVNMPLGTRLAMGEGVCGAVAKTRAPLRVDNYREWDQQSPKYQGLPIAATLAVPMFYGGELIGVLGVSKSEKTERKFSQEDERLLTLFAFQSASAVHGARLLDDTRVRAEQLALLYDAGLTLNRTLEPRAQLELLCRIATQALHADNTSFFRYNAAQNDLGMEFGVGADQELDGVRKLSFPLGAERGLVGWVAQTRVPFYLPDVTTDPRWIVVDPTIRSALWVPVLHNEQLLGVLSASSARVNAFTAQDERLFVLFANQVAVAMENARLFTEEQARSKELATLYELSRGLMETDDFNSILSLTARHIVHACQITFARALLVEGDEFVVRAAFPIRALARELEIGHRESVAALAFCQSALEQAEPIIVGAANLDINNAERELLSLGLAQLFCLVPWRIGENQRGLWILGEARKEERAPFTAEKLRLIGSISEQVASALLRVSLRKQTERQLGQLQSQHEIDIAITGSTDLTVTLNFLLSKATEQLRVDAISILLLNPLTRTLEYAAGRGFRTRGVGRSRLRLDEGYAGKAVLERRITHVSNLQDPDSAFARAKLYSGEGFIGYYAVPLIAKGQVKGVLEIFQRAPLEPERAWLDFLQALATQAAIAIESAQLFENLEHSNMDLTLAYDTTIEGWSHALDLRDRETEGHTLRVTEITMRLAKAMGIGDAELIHIRRGGLLHDIGKMGVSDSILLKPGPLTDDEWKVMRLHPQFAFDLMSPITYLKLALDIPYCHHEKWDGTGYPRGLKGEQIPLAARLFAIVDVWDALRSDRPYRAAWAEEQVIEHIRSLAGTHFDPQVVRVFLELGVLVTNRDQA